MDHHLRPLTHVLGRIRIGEVGIHVTVSHGIVCGAVSRQPENFPRRMTPDLAFPVKAPQSRNKFIRLEAVCKQVTGTNAGKITQARIDSCIGGKRVKSRNRLFRLALLRQNTGLLHESKLLEARVINRRQRLQGIVEFSVGSAF